MANIPLKTMSFEGLDNTYTIPESFNDLDGSLSVNKISGVLPVSKGGTGTNSLDGLKFVLDVPEIDTTLTEEGKAADAKATGDAIDMHTLRVNIAKYTSSGVLNDANFATAFANALEASKYIYIPAGNYDFDTIGKISVTDDVDVLCSADAVFSRTTGTDWMFDFQQCNVRWDGGTFKSGVEGSKVLLYNSAVNGYNGGAINFKQCKRVEIFNVKTPYNVLPAVIVSENSDNVNIHHCEFKKCVFSAIHFLRSGKNLRVADCLFDGMYIPTNIGDEGWYCYAVCTGLRRVKNTADPEDQGDMDGDTPWTPPEGLVYERNIVLNSEDSGLDTHGARNVIIENNTILQCNTCITAYNDSARVNRPQNWTMDNVIIRNNYCKSDYVNVYDSHPFVLIANSNRNGRDSINYIIENNVFDTVNNNSKYNKCILPVYRIQKCTIINNVLKANKSVNSCIFVAASNCEINNNVFDSPLNQAISNGFSAKTFARNNEYINAENFAYQSSTYYNYLKNDDFNYSVNDKMVAYLEIVKSGNDIKISTTHSISANAQFTNNSYACNLNNGVLTCVNDLELVEGQRVSMGAYVGTVEQLLSDKSARITTTAPNGNYTVTGTLATLVDIYHADGI